MLGWRQWLRVQSLFRDLSRAVSPISPLFAQSSIEIVRSKSLRLVQSHVNFAGAYRLGVIWTMNTVLRRLRETHG